MAERLQGAVGGPLRDNRRLCVQSSPLRLVQVAGQGFPGQFRKSRHEEGL
jgi:hypothetical protein